MNYAILCADGIGDALLMMIVAHHIKKLSPYITIFHKSPHVVSPLFPSATFLPYPPIDQFEHVFKTFDHIIFQNDHSEKAFILSNLRTSGALPSCLFLLITPSKLYRAGDFVFEPKRSLVENVIDATKALFHLEDVTKENGIISLDSKKKRQYPKRIIIHPTSSDPKRNWRPSQYIQLALKLKKQGFDPCFVMTKKEKTFWPVSSCSDFSFIICDNLLETANILHSSGFFIGNDSGIGHLASNLGIPTLTISGNPKRVSRWRPSFTLNAIVTLSFNLPNFKGLVFRHFDGRFRDKYWHYFLPVGKVLKRFNHLMETTYNQKDFS